MILSVVHDCCRPVSRLAVLALLLAAAGPAAAQSEPYEGLPQGALVLEEQPLPASPNGDRALVLWIDSGEVPPSQLQRRNAPDDPTEAYTCPDQTRGQFYRAPTRVSLVDSHARLLINTVVIKPEWGTEDQYDIPFRIRPGFYYSVPGPLTNGAGKPHILELKDWNDDGKALEFGIFDQQACAGPDTLVAGYSEQRDRVVIYPFRLAISGDVQGEPRSPREWVDRFLTHKPVSARHWLYELFYNSGYFVRFDIRYVAAQEWFEGTETWRDAERDR